MTSWVWPAVVVTCLIVGILFPTLIGDQRLAFRDVSHFYTPLYDYVASRCANEWLPRWNPLDQTGVPLIGETTTAVLYPIRYAIFALIDETSIAMAWYVATHLIIASLAAGFAARCWHASRAASAAASIMYPMSGCVWFLYTNPPFLVGAAWLPLTLAAFVSPRSMTFQRRVGIAGLAMAMMILGGDPQSALHVTMIAAGVMIGRGIRSRSLPTGWALPIVAPALAAMLAFPQLAASIDWSRQSSRVVSQASKLDPPRRGTQRYEAFQFSVPPWHAAELLTPNAFGSLLPIYRRISATIPGDGRIWTPTIYLGLIAFVAMIDRLRRIRTLGIDAPMAIAIGSFLLATGQFGLVWWMRATVGLPNDVDPAAGGAYWILYHYFPGYDALRYPAKWLPMFAVASSIVTARWLDRVTWASFQPSLVVVASLLLGGLCINTYRRFVTFPTIDPSTLPADRFWGPLDLVGGASEVQTSLLYSALVLSMIAMVFTFSHRYHWRRRTRTLAIAGLLLVDLGIASNHWTYTVDVAAENRLMAEVTAQAIEGNRAIRWMRTQSGGGWPGVWKRTHNPNRLLEVEVSQRASWFGRWHLGHRQVVLNNMISIQSKSMQEFWIESNELARSVTMDDRDAHWRSLRQRFAIDGVVHTTDNARDVSDTILVDAAWVRERFSTIDDREKQEVSFAAPTILVRPVYQDGNWTAAYRPPGDGTWSDVTVVSHQRIHQAVSLPAGTWQVRFRYRPWWFIPSLAAAAITWLAILLVGFFKSPFWASNPNRRSRRRPKPRLSRR